MKINYIFLCQVLRKILENEWLAIEPSMKKYPAISPYSFSLNSPLIFNDPEGKDIIVTVRKNPEGGDKIIIASTIYITGVAANDFNARGYTKQSAKMNR